MKINTKIRYALRTIIEIAMQKNDSGILQKEIAEKHRKPLAHIAINWVTQQSGITSALVGARTPEQIEINAGAGEWELSQEELQQIQDSHNRIFGIQ